ncbi:APC family permease [Ferrimicrobium acidiphilum]|uniref:APC family permease n=1 Tax=Ferrimicrobium acidiphilum TaxID=121039 RepID=UPI0023F1F0F2|nr:APC family permease [Ferrimicrobium acidiphilum]
MTEDIRPTVKSTRLRQNSLSTMDILGVSLADTAPAMSFFFSFAAIAAAAGVASPLAIIVAAVAVLLKLNSLTEFTKVTPSSGSYVSYIGKAFGAIPGVMTAWALSVGYIIAVGYVMAIMGGWTSLILSKYVHISVPWEPITIVFVALVSFLVYRGVKISARWATIAFVFELLLIIISMVAIVITNSSHINFASFEPSLVSRGISGMGLAFPLAVFLFIGVGNPGAMVEETRNARRSVPRAIYIATIIATVIYVLMAWTTSIAFHNNASTIGGLSAPFVTAADKALGPVSVLVYLAGLTSTFSSLIGATTAQTRIIFSAGREKLLPSVLGKLSDRYGTPVISLIAYSVIALIITLLWASHGNPLNIAGDIATLGTIPIILVYLALNLALPVYFFREHRDKFSILRHLIIPILGVAALVLPLWGMIKPGQPYPFNVFPWIVLALLVVSFVFGVVRSRQIPDLGQKIGSVLADDFE